MSYTVALGPVAPGSVPASGITYPDERKAVAAAELLVAETGVDREVWSLSERDGVPKVSAFVRYVSAGA